MESAMTDVVHLSSPASRDGRIAYGMRRNLAREALARFDLNSVWRNATILHLPETVLRLSLVAAATVSAVFLLSSAILA